MASSVIVTFPESLAASPVSVVFPTPTAEAFHSVASVASMRLLPSSSQFDGANVVLEGDVAPGDGGGGIYVYDVDSLIADNGSSVIKPDDLTALQAGRWLAVGGGNIGLVSAFEQIPAKSIPTNTDLIRTSKHGATQAAGEGAAEYAYSPVVDAPYVARFPRLASIDAANRGFRFNHMGHAINFAQAGARGDSGGPGTGTDNSGLLAEIDDYFYHRGGGKLLLPWGRFRLASRPVFDSLMDIEGVGWTEHAGRIGSVTTSWLGTPFDNFTVLSGSILVFDADIPGPIFYASNISDNAVTAASLPADQKYALPGARGSRLAHCLLFGGGGNNRGAHGVDARVRIELYNVATRFFSGDGIRVHGSSGARSDSPWGNVSKSRLIHCQSRFVQGHGLWIEGNESSLVHIDDHDCAINGGFNFVSKGHSGETYVNCHAASGNLSAPGAPSFFPGQANHRAALVAETPPLDALSIPAVGPQLSPRVGYVGSIYVQYSGVELIGFYTENGWGEKAYATVQATPTARGNTLAQRGNWTADSAVRIDGKHRTDHPLGIRFGGTGINPILDMDAAGSTAALSGTFERGSFIWRTGTLPNQNDRWLVAASGTQGKTITAGLTATTTAGSPIVAMSSVGNINPGDYITITGVGSGKVASVSAADNQITMVNNQPSAVASAAVAFTAPVFEERGGRAAARANSAAADVATLVADFNDLLAKLRTAGLLAS